MSTTPRTLEEVLSDNIAVEELFGKKDGRWYQYAAQYQVEEILTAQPKARIIVRMPTGAGKTLTSGMILLSDKVAAAIVPDGSPLRVLFITHKHRLRTQAESSFADEHRILTITDLAKNITGNHKVEIYYHSAFQPIPDNAGYHLVVIDEAHHEAMASIQYLLEHIDAPIIGLSATPIRADGMVLKFTHEVAPISREQAVEEGWLAQTNINSFVDVSGTDKTDILTKALIDYSHEMGQTMVFVKTKKEVAAITCVLRDLGYNAVGLLTQSDIELDIILDKFSAGHIQFVVNCNRISEGVDTKGCSDVILGRQFGSYAQINQVIGRAARPDSPCNVWELINPLSDNLDTTVIVGTPANHRLIYTQNNQWKEKQFDYVTHKSNKQLGITPVGNRVH